MPKWKYKGISDDDDKYEKFGRIGGRTKRTKNSKGDLELEFILAEKSWPVNKETFTARVVEVHKRYCFVSIETIIGEVDTSDVWLARVARKYLKAAREERNFVCVGDRVFCTPAESRDRTVESELPQCMINHLAPRTSKISRIDPLLQEREHVLASNVDQLLVVASFLAPRVKWGLIDRYLVLAELQGIDVLLVLNKKDLLDVKKGAQPEFVKESYERAAYYKKIGYKVFMVQANEEDALANEDMQAIAKELSGKITITSGHSGVGKSSLLNLFDPEIIQEVEPDSDIFYKGRHTTTYASFIKLGIGGFIIDTPGIRSFAIHERGAIQLSHGFREFRDIAKTCKFRECRHIDEPECKIIEAVESGLIPRWRYQSFVGIFEGTTGREGRIRDQNLEGDN